MYKDEYHPKVKKDLKKSDKSVQSRIKDIHIPKILANPYIAEELRGDLSGIYSYHFKESNVQYRISYVINEAGKVVYVLLIGKRESFYQVLRRRL